MAIKLKSYTKIAQADHMLLVGVSGSGKTTACSSYLREATMLLYVSKAEPHSPIYMSNGVSLFEGATVDNLFAVALDVVEENDKELLPFAAKMELGTILNPDQSWAKMKAYLAESKGSSIKTVVLDSLSGFFSTIRGTSRFANLCRNEKGNHNNFKEAEAYLIMHEELNTALISCRDAGINTVCILGAKNIGVGTESMAIGPDLPVYSVAEKMPFRYSDVVVLTTRDLEGADEYRTIVDFGVAVERSKVNVETKEVEKFVSMKPRLSFMPPNLEVAWLPNDLYNLRKYVEELKKHANE